jgi:hypothetical protein
MPITFEDSLVDYSSARNPNGKRRLSNNEASVVYMNKKTKNSTDANLSILQEDLSYEESSEYSQ